jgi:hypothetical protein
MWTRTNAAPSRQPNSAFVVLIDAPTHSEVLLEPMNFSLGDFSVLLHEKTELSEVIECEIDVLNKVSEGCRMTVVRVEEFRAGQVPHIVHLKSPLPCDSLPVFEHFRPSGGIG